MRWFLSLSCVLLGGHWLLKRADLANSQSLWTCHHCGCLRVLSLPDRSFTVANR